MTVAVQVIGKNMIVNYNGKTITLMKGDYRFQAIVEKMKNKNYDSIPEIVERRDIPKLEFKNRGYFFEGQRLPTSLEKRVAEFKNEGLPIEYLIKFFKKLKKNPNPRSIEMLYTFLETNGHPITQEGNFIAYRYVTSDFKDQHTGKMDNRVGCTVSMPREDVDSEPTRTCSSGLHVASWSYVKDSSTIVEVSVDPQDVVCVPDDYNGTKMRVCRFVVECVSGGKESSDVLYKEETTAKRETKKKEKSLETKKLQDRFKRKIQEDKSLVLLEYWSSSTLTVTTVRGTKWRFHGISPLEASRLLNAKSVGKYYRDKILTTYEREKV